MARTIVITGITRGIGRGLVEEFDRLGHKIIGCGRSVDQVSELQNALGSDHHFSAVDVTDDALVADWASKMLQAHGAPDLLINNAAIINRNSPLIDVPVSEFDAVIDINIKGVANVSRHFVPAMIERNHGVIVNLSSGWGRSTSPDVAPYCATKWAIEGLSKAMADELPSGLACVPLSPGVVNTEMLQSCFGGGADTARKPDAFAKVAAPFLLALGPKDNGQSLTVPT
ncbi:MAG: SDR family oxidoreductase [Limisphaerales bacterium]